MASRPSQIEPVTADDVLTVQFTHIKRGGYDTQEVDAFLDRIAFTFDAEGDDDHSPGMSADDVRTVQFGHAKRGGYDTGEVDNFLDRVVEVFTGGSPGPTMADAPAAELQRQMSDDSTMAVDPEPEAAPIPEPAPVPEVASNPEPAPAPEEAPPPEPEADAPVEAPMVSVAAAGAAGAHLHDPDGAAQKLLAAAQMAADALTADADAYAQQVRSEADTYDRATRSEADGYATTVTATAETQASAIREVAADEARRVAEEARSELVVQIDALSAAKVVLERDNATLQDNLDTERGRILLIIDQFRETLVSDSDTEAAAPPTGAQSDVADEVEAAFSADPPAPDPVDTTDSTDTTDTADATDATAEASRSVFDLADDEPAEPVDTSTDWIDDVPAPLPNSPATGEATIFDIEADVGADDNGPGERFFEELRQADSAGDNLGPADEDTDAALSAFFEPEEEPDTDGRWRDRFGPGRG